MKKLIISCLILALFGLSISQNLGTDPNTKSRPQEFYTKNVEMNWSLDLLAKTLNGTSDITLVAVSNGTKELRLDIWNELDIEENKCYYSDAKSQKQSVQCVVDKTSTSPELQGYALVVTLNSPILARTVFTITVTYFIDNEEGQTGQTGSMSIKFSDYEVSASRRYPSAFSHSQMIYARSLSPFQDSPSVKFTWKANVKVIPNVQTSGFIMSGEPCQGYTPKETPDDITFCYESGATTYPSYQIGFLAGDLKAQDVLGTSMKIITFANWMEEGYEYLSNAGQYMSALINYMGIDYPFEKVNVAIPPIDFPYSSMENGNLIFISKSVIPDENNMGDELGHFVLTKALAKAWFGQKSTITNWQSLWLSEGISTFVARQAIKSIYDYNYATNNLVANQSLFTYIQEIIKTQGNETSSPYLFLTPDSTGLDPFRALNPVVREKGNQFLEYLQHFAITPEYMQDFLQKWIVKPTFSQDSKENETVYTFNTEDFKETYDDFLDETYAYPETPFNLSDFSHWVNGSGMPKKEYQDKLLSLWDSPATQEVLFLAEQVVELRGVAVPKRFVEIAKYWSANNLLLFLSYFQNNIDNIRRSRFDYRLFKTVDQLLELQTHRAIEVRTAFVELALRTEYIHNVLDSLERILVSTGNLEIILPLYQTLVDIGYRQVAQEIYQQGKIYYHPIAVSRIQTIISQP